MLQYAPYNIASKKSLDLPSHNAAKKSLLIQQMKKQRMAFAKTIHLLDTYAEEKNNVLT